MNTSVRNKQKEAEESPCVWMQAGLIRKKTCETDYQCTDCSLDAAMYSIASENRRLKNRGFKGRGNREKIIPWKEKMRTFPISKRPCVHHMKRRIGYRTCTNNYKCGECEFDQCFEDQYTVNAKVTPMDVLEVEGIRIPQGYYFHRGHTWAKIEEGTSVLVGIDDFVLRLLGSGDSIEAPLLGKEVKQETPAILFKRGKETAKFVSPVTGVITGTNQKLREQGALANREPYSDGWVMKVQVIDLRSDLKNLMINKETERYIIHEVALLNKVIEEQAGLPAIERDVFREDIFGNIPELSWRKLVSIFLHS